MGLKPRDITGQRFNRLIALELVEDSKGKRDRIRIWKCRCDCGNEVLVAQRYLGPTKSNTKSCGCIIGQHKRTHGATNTAEFRIWDSMRRRCANPEHPSFKDYGGRGIRVCDGWKDSFETFIADMGPRPSPRHSLDRYPNNDGNYEPDNCRWATMREQSNNRRSSLWITVNSETRTAAQWDHLRGFLPGTVWKRLHAGWSAERAVTTPPVPPSLRRAGVSGGI